MDTREALLENAFPEDLNSQLGGVKNYKPSADHSSVNSKSLNKHVQSMKNLKTLRDQARFKDKNFAADGKDQSDRNQFKLQFDNLKAQSRQ